MTDIHMSECALSNVNEMTQGAMVQRQIEGSTVMAKRPTIMNDSGIEFEVKNPDSFIELNKTEIEITYSITKANGDNLEATDNVGPVNYPIASFFENVEIKLNDKTITHGSSNYAERANMEVLMTYNRDALAWASL